MQGWGQGGMAALDASGAQETQTFLCCFKELIVCGFLFW